MAILKQGMGTNEDFYKREEDRKWRESVESRLVSLTSSQKVTDAQLEEIELEIEGVRLTLNGDSRERDGGLIGQTNQIETSLNGVMRILHPDATGHAGLLNEFREVKNQVFQRERIQSFKWNFLNSAIVPIGSIIVALISASALLITNWDKVSKYLSIKYNGNDPVEQMIEKAKHPKSRHRRIRVVIPAPDQDEQ